MKLRFKFLFFLVGLVFWSLFFNINFLVAASKPVDVRVLVTGCVVNGICEDGENYTVCPSDCPEIVTSTPPTTSTPGGGGGFVDNALPQITGLQVKNIRPNTVVVQWFTSKTTYCQLAWGQTSEYKSGSVAEVSYFLDHEITLNDLLPNTSYHLKVSCLDLNKNKVEANDFGFTTLATPVAALPENVIGLTAETSNKKIVLWWQTPMDANFAGVVIMRSTVFYPQSVNEGYRVYSGLGQLTQGQYTFTDLNVKNNLTYYYTVFSYDNQSHWSSGAVVAATPVVELAITTSSSPVSTTTLGVVDNTNQVSTSTNLSFQDFSFTQYWQPVPVQNNVVSVSSTLPLLVSIPIQKVNGEAKTILVQINNPETNKQEQFLFVKNDQTGEYQAVFSPLLLQSNSQVVIQVLDHNNSLLEAVTGSLKFTDTAVLTAGAGVSGASFLASISNRLVGVSGYLLFAIMVVYLLIKFITKNNHRPR